MNSTLSLVLNLDYKTLITEKRKDLHTNNVKKQIGLLSLLLVLAVFWGSSIVLAQPNDITRTNITFENGQFTLHGELVMPDSAQNAPALIFLVGSGENSSYRTLYKDFIQKNLEALFLSEGFALLYFDKRGIGESEGKWQRSDLYERASDAKAAINFLQTQGRINANRIGVVGHSEGGWVAQIMGDRYQNELTLIASIAAPTYDIKLKLTNEYYSDNLCENMPDKEAFDKAGKKAISDINWVSWFPVKKAWRHLREIRFFDPAPHLREIDIPAFFAFGENDAEVYPGWALGTLNETFEEEIPTNFSLQIIPAANHDMKLAGKCESFEDTRNKPYSDYFRQVFKDWVLSNI